MPPQHGKSEIVSKWFPVWYLGKRPDHRIMHTSYADRYSQKWGRQARSVMASWGCLFGLSVSTEKAEMREWEIANRGGSMFSAGVGGELTGRSANLLIVDDPHKNAEEAASEVSQESVWDWMQTTALTRLHSDGKLVVIATRWHQRDLIGRLMEAWNDSGERYRVVNLPAVAMHNDELGRAEGEPLWPERRPLSFLNAQKRTFSAYWWNALYQGRPTQHDKAEFPGDYFADQIWTDSIPAGCSPQVVVLDPSKGKNAKKGDYSASVFVGFHSGKAYVDARIERCPVSKAVDNTLDLAFRYGCRAVGYEANNFQELIGGIFDERLSGNRLHGISIIPLTNTASKEGRIQSLDPFLRNGELRFVDNVHTRLLVNQLREFPMAAHDDGPDALEMAIRLCLEFTRDDSQIHPAFVDN